VSRINRGLDLTNRYSSVGNALRGVPRASVTLGTAQRPFPTAQGARRGMTIAELMVALFIMTTAMVAIVQLLAAAAGQRRAVEERRIALQEVANAAERMGSLAWDETGPEKRVTWEPSAEFTSALPQATCTAEVAEETGPPVMRRIRLSVTWPNAVGQTREPVTVAIWKFKEEQP